MHKELNISRNFNNPGDARKYFTFPNKDKNGTPSTYQMKEKQMKEWENAFIKKIVKRVIHNMKGIT
jgi:hypothetical protein|tara:strand:+ start:143 stop:340 length:198 start_codon:yes stop_codon:yes gene_type:complete